ncbi:hypothetical protein [Streptomyces djakartensis]|uniref:Uncharacterized protein n=1 Tax=Streptomyces djakartensis TaxID=68193 RepID=A0ABQ3AGT4_9ACTN|nr:hypothetical protein [Streptomyces djakartensis]GGY52536.1 hypothetical protein GCM10010384_67850 [Streptomyces djakartensis]
MRTALHLRVPGFRNRYYPHPAVAAATERLLGTCGDLENTKRLEAALGSTMMAARHPGDGTVTRLCRATVP